MEHSWVFIQPLQVPSSPCLPLACSHSHEAEQLQVWVPAAEMPNVLQVISIHHAAGRGQNRAGEWFLLLSSHKTVQTERERKRGWTEALSSSSPDSVPGCRAMYGEILPVHIQSYWTLTILLVTSPFASWVPRFPTLQTFPIRLKNLALTPSTNPLAWLTCTGSCVNLSFNSATRRSHASLSPGVARPEPLLHLEDEHSFNSRNAESRSREERHQQQPRAAQSCSTKLTALNSSARY